MQRGITSISGSVHRKCTSRFNVRDVLFCELQTGSFVKCSTFQKGIQVMK